MICDIIDVMFGDFLVIGIAIDMIDEELLVDLLGTLLVFLSFVNIAIDMDYIGLYKELLGEIVAPMKL